MVRNNLNFALAPRLSFFYFTHIIADFHTPGSIFVYYPACRRLSGPILFLSLMVGSHIWWKIQFLASSDFPMLNRSHSTLFLSARFWLVDFPRHCSFLLPHHKLFWYICHGCFRTYYLSPCRDISCYVHNICTTFFILSHFVGSGSAECTLFPLDVC